ncbi:hypothetical protein FGO68_gene9739 [Halteria grandinella]|uniref:Uncharacterized protein n=1 Tax=Halteria grandinella TaxID=5974 RepID=A0A8J8P070_HALGN|nr:hypothetical protein FGO68_gene9739 [Halteria grandinella]
MSSQHSVGVSPTPGILRKQIIAGIKMSLSQVTTPNFEGRKGSQVRINDKASIHELSAKQSDIEIDELDFKTGSSQGGNGGKTTKRQLTLSEIIKSRGITNNQRHSNYNDMIDEVFERERKDLHVNLKKLDAVIRQDPKLFEMSFKRSLLSHIVERKRKIEEEIENKLRKQRQEEIEEASERLRKLKMIQDKFNIHLRTKKTESGEEIICLDIPFDQKMRNECNDYHYFFQYKRDRCPILKDKNRMGSQFESGYHQKVLEEFESAEIIRRQKAEKEKQRIADLEKLWRQEKIKGKGDEELVKRIKSRETEDQQAEQDALLLSQNFESGIIESKEVQIQQVPNHKSPQKSNLDLSHAAGPQSKSAMGHYKNSEAPKSAQKLDTQYNVPQKQVGFSIRPNTTAGNDVPQKQRFQKKQIAHASLGSIDENYLRKSVPAHIDTGFDGEATKKRQTGIQARSNLFTPLASEIGSNKRSSNAKIRTQSNWMLQRQPVATTSQNFYPMVESTQASTAGGIQAKRQSTYIRSPTGAETSYGPYNSGMKSPNMRNDDGSQTNILNNTTSGFRRQTVSLRRNSILSGLGTPKPLVEDNMSTSNLSKTVKQQFSLPTSPTLIKNTFLGTKPLESFTPGRFWVNTAVANSSRAKKNETIGNSSFEKPRDTLSPDQPRKDGERFNKRFTGETPKVADHAIQGLIKKYPPPPNILKIQERIQVQQTLRANTHNLFGQPLKKSQEGKSLTDAFKIGFSDTLSKKFKFTKSAAGGSLAGALKDLRYEFAQQQVENQETKKKLFTLMKLTHLENDNGKDDKKDMELQQLIQQLIGQEEHTTYERMKEIDFARLNNFHTLYDWKVADYDEQQQLAQEIKNEYMSGKFDPEMAIKYERTAREMLKRGMLIN